MVILLIYYFNKEFRARIVKRTLKQIFRHFYLNYLPHLSASPPSFQHAIVLFQLPVKLGHLLAIFDFYHLQRVDKGRAEEQREGWPMINA